MAVFTGLGIGGTINPYEQLAKNLNKQGSVSNTVQNSVQAGRANSNPGFAFGMGMGAQNGKQGAISTSGIPGYSGSGSGSSNRSSYSSTPAAASSRAGTQTTYYDPQGNKQTGWIIDGQTYKDQNGSSRVDVGSQVQTGNGWYELGQNGGVKIDGPTWGNGNSTGGSTGGSSSGSYGGSSGGSSGGSYGGDGTPQKPITVQYYDPSGRQQIGYMINGQTYIDQAGTQRIGTGSMVQTANGWYQLGADGKGVQVEAPRQTTYTDKYGDTRTAWILGTGQTYLDPQGINRIPVGSVVQTANGKYLMTEGGGVPITDAELRQRQQNEMFAQRQQSMVDAVNAATDAGVLGYQQMLPGINAQYDTAAKQAYGNYMLEKQDMPEQMARLGLGGQGVTESTAANMANTYQNNLNQSELARRAAIQQVNNDIAKLRADAQAKIAQGKFDLGGEQFDAYKWLQELMMQQNQFDTSLNWEKEQFAQSQSAQEKQARDQMILALAEMGFYEKLAEMGVSPEEIKRVQREHQEDRAMQAYSAYSSGRSSGGSGSRSSKSKSESTKISYSKLLTEMMSADDPYSKLDEMAETYDISSADYDKLVKELNNSFDKEMADIKAGRLTYEEIRDGDYARESTNRWRLMYGDDGYQDLLDAAYEMYKKRKGIK